MATNPSTCSATVRQCVARLSLLAALVVTPCTAQVSQGSNGRVILGVDPLAATLIKQLENAKTPYERAMLESQVEKMLAMGSLQRSALAAMPKNMSAEHAQYHPHATRDCDLLQPRLPGDKFDWKGHMESMMAESAACPICNPPPQSSRSSDPVSSASREQPEHPQRKNKPKMNAAEWLELLESLGVEPNNDNWLNFSDRSQEWGSKGLLSSASGLVDPTLLPVDRSEYGSWWALRSDYVVDDILGMENQTFLGYGKAAADGIPASLPLATIVIRDPGAAVGSWFDWPSIRVVDKVDVNNSVARIHDIYLQQLGEPFWNFTSSEVTKINNYARDNLTGPSRLPFAFLGGVGNIYHAFINNFETNQAERLKYEAIQKSMYPPNYPRAFLPPITPHVMEQLKKSEAQQNLKVLQEAYGGE